jgi:hypothetical protein
MGIPPQADDNRAGAAPTPAPQGAADPVETAWRIHGALADWTGKVDGKAAFALSIESAILAGLVALGGDGHPLSRVHGTLGRAALWGSTGLVVVGLVLAVAAVAPRMRTRRTVEEWRTNFVYFGHLRHWSAARLCDVLRREDPLPVLSRQLVVMSELAWRKHLLVRTSLWAAVAGVVLAGLAALAS